MDHILTFLYSHRFSQEQSPPTSNDSLYICLVKCCCLFFGPLHNCNLHFPSQASCWSSLQPHDRIPCPIWKKLWKQHLTNEQILGHLSPISLDIQKDELYPLGTAGKAGTDSKVKFSGWFPHIDAPLLAVLQRNIHQLLVVTGSRREGVPRAEVNRDRSREIVYGNCAISTTWWRWYIYIYIYILKGDIKTAFNLQIFYSAQCAKMLDHIQIYFN